MTALVTADLESHVVAVDLAQGRIVRELRTLAGPRSIESVEGRIAVVAHTTEGAVSLVAAPELRVRRVLGGFDEPRYTAAHPDGRHVYITDSGRSEVVVVDLTRGVVGRRTAVGGPARHVSLAPGGRTLWVALGPKASEVAVLDVSQPDRPHLVAHVRPPYLAHDVGWTPRGDAVWVTSGDRGTIGVYDGGSHRLLRRVGADAAPQHATFSAGHAYVASGEDGLLRVYALDGRLLRTETVPVGSYNVQRGGGFVITPSLEQGTLTVLATSGRVLHRIPVARSSHDACLVSS